MGTFINPTTEFVESTSITTESGTTTEMSEMEKTTEATTLFDDSTDDGNISNVTWSPNSRDLQYVQAFYFLFVFGLIVIACIMCCNACSAFWVGLREKMRRERCRQNFMDQYEGPAGQNHQGQGGQESLPPRPRGIRTSDGMIEHRIHSQHGGHGQDRDDWDEEPPPRYTSRSKYMTGKNQVRFTSSASLHNYNQQQQRRTSSSTN